MSAETASEIVRELAREHPLHITGEGADAQWECFFCEATEDHEPDCLWRRAVDLADA